MHSDGDFDAVRLIAETIEHSEVAGLARANIGDIDRAWEAIKIAKKPRIHTFISTSDIQFKHQFRKNKDEIRDCCKCSKKSKEIHG